MDPLDPVQLDIARYGALKRTEEIALLRPYLPGEIVRRNKGTAGHALNQFGLSFKIVQLVTSFFQV
jgi:hypothetical protein